MLKLKLQYFGHRMRLEKTLMLGNIEGRRSGSRGWDGSMVSSTQWTWVWANSGRQWKTGKPGMLQSMGLQRVGHDLETEQQRNWSSIMVTHQMQDAHSPAMTKLYFQALHIECDNTNFPGIGDGQGGLACCDSWGRKESDTTERLIWSDLI